MKTKTNLKAGDFPPGPSLVNHNETLVTGLWVKTAVKAAGAIIHD